MNPSRIYTENAQMLRCVIESLKAVPSPKPGLVHNALRHAILAAQELEEAANDARAMELAERTVLAAGSVA